MVTKIEEVLRHRRVKAAMAIVCLKLQPPGKDRDEAEFILEEYLKLMEKPIDPALTRGKIV